MFHVIVKFASDNERMMSNQKITQLYPQKKRRIAHEGKAFKEEKPQGLPSAEPSKAEHMTILKGFDLNWEYGPCTNITRLERWHRAEKLHQNPPQIVKQLIESHPLDKDYTDNLWNDYAL